MKSLFRMLVTLTMFAVSVSLAVAQEKPAAKKAAGHAKQSKEAGKKPGGNAMPMLVKPSAEMQRLTHMFVGKWTTTEKHEPSDYMPQGGTGIGTETVKAGPGGNSMIADYRSQGTMGGKFTGHGIIFWDAKRGLYSSVWCDNMSPGGCETSATGKWEGNDLVFSAEGEMTGKKFRMKHVYTDITPDSFTFYIDSSEDGGSAKRMMTIKYTKSVPTTPPAALPKQ